MILNSVTNHHNNYDNKSYSVKTITSSGLPDYLSKSLQEGKLFAFYSTYIQNGISFVRGCVIDDVSHLLAEDREVKINQIID